MAPPSPSSSLESLATALSSRHPRDRVLQQLRSLQTYGDVVDDPELWLTTAVENGFKDMPIEAVPECCCGSDDHVRLCRFLFWNLLALRECRRCGTMFVSPRLTPGAVARIFSEHYFDPGNPEYWGRRREPVFEDVMRHLDRLGCRSVFDVGAAYGHFVRFAQRRGLRAAGCDISRTAVTWGREHLGVEVHHGSLGELGLPQGAFDAAVSLDALFHTGDPHAELLAMRQLIRPGGHIVLRLRNPWKTRLRARWEGRKAVGKEPLPALHLWAFTPESIRSVAARAGLETVAVEPAAYSRTRLGPVQSLWAGFNRAAAGRGVLAIRTQNFNAVLRRPA
jgi:SAM-dependent methyltransferase